MFVIYYFFTNFRLVVLIMFALIKKVHMVGRGGRIGVYSTYIYDMKLKLGPVTGLD